MGMMTNWAAMHGGLSLVDRIVFGMAFVGATAGMAQAEPQARAAPPWPTGSKSSETLEQRLAPPRGFVRSSVTRTSFGAWLRSLPMKPADSPVMLYTGVQKPRQDVHVGVIDIDVEKRDLQQCADAVMRLRAEWLWGIGAKERIAFDYTGGGRVPYTRYAAGERPNEDGKRWRRSAKADPSYTGFRRYMTNVFAYAGTYSLSRELISVPDGSTPQIGDVVIKGGFPGHAVLVIDMAENALTGEKRFLLAQSYMPAQDIHVLKDPAAPDGSPWYAAPITWPLRTPEWTFEKGSLKRWAE